jgi:polyisoprenoid-binding protein YceI
MVEVRIFLLAVFALVSSVGVAQKQYVLTGGSSITISGTSTISDWKVRSQAPVGKLVLEQSGKISTVEVVLPVESIKSERGETMDNKMYGALKKEEHPRIFFVLSKPVELGKAGSTVASGEVTIAGVSRPMSFDVEVDHKNGQVSVVGRKSVKMTAFGVEPPTAMFGQIVAGDDIVVDLNLIFAIGNEQ